jgi:predicted porin
MTNQLRNFDEKANQFSLNMAKLTMLHDPDPVGFRFDLGFGRAFDTIHASEKAPQIFQYIEQAYVSLKPPKAKGFEADFGEFVTSAGAEVIETKDNWNYSRSLLFAWAIPYYHFGLRTSIPVTKSITGGLQVVNGWNNVEDNNSGKTVGVTGALAKPKYTLNVNYYVGPEKPDTNKGYRNLIDTTLLLTPKPNSNFYLNYDYAQERSLSGVLDHYQGFAGAARFQLTRTIALAPRAEIFNDPQGFSTGMPQQLSEFTMTGEYKIAEGFLSRVEYRRDHSDQMFFQRGTTPSGSQNQSTILVGMVVYYGPKR